MLKRIITNGNQRAPSDEDAITMSHGRTHPKGKPNFRSRDLFKLAGLESKIDQQDFSGNITKEQHNESNS